MQTLKTILVLITLLVEIHCFCENAHIIVCDDLSDLSVNQTDQWRHVQVGSLNFKSDPPNHMLTASATLRLSRAVHLTFIHQLKTIETPFTISQEPRVEYLNFYANNIRHIEDFTFNNMKSLKEVLLRDNKITHLGRAIFQNTSLEFVDLSNNDIESITTCFYQSQIKWITIKNNKIDYIKTRAFPTKLELLHLDHNRIEELDDDTFTNLVALKELSITHNLLTKIPKLSALQSLEYLHLSFNKIEVVNEPMHNYHLDYIDLSSNRITTVDLNLFGNQRGWPLVLLMFNRMTNLDFPDPKKKTDLALYGNPWNCDCLFTIEQIIRENKHYTSCSLKSFTSGSLPMCVENGKCGEREMIDRDVAAFEKRVQECSDRFYCNFYK